MKAVHVRTMAECVPGKSLLDELKRTGKHCYNCEVTCLCDICHKHEGEILKFYCKTHDVVGCATCIVLEHRRCDEVCTLDEIAGSEDFTVKYRNLSTALGILKQDLSEQVKVTTENWRMVETYRDEAIVKMDEIQNRLLQKLKKLRNQVDLETERKVSKEANKVKEVIATENIMEAKVAHVEKALKDHEEMGQGLHFFIAVKKAEETLEHLEKMLDNLRKENKVEKFSFSENPKLMKMMQEVDTFGELQTHGADKRDKALQCLLVHLYR